LLQLSWLKEVILFSFPYRSQLFFETRVPVRSFELGLILLLQEASEDVDAGYLAVQLAILSESVKTNLNIGQNYLRTQLELGKWECYKCSFIFEGESPPEECPKCHYSLTFWLETVEEKQPTVRDFMRPGIIKIRANQSAWEAAVLMKEKDTTSVIVTINDEPAGIVTERDILYKIAAEDLPASKVPLKKIMSSPIITISANESLTDAIRLMAKHHIRRVLVVDNGRAVGMLGQRSIIGGSFRATKGDEGKVRE
jgi:CBS domain-containing protein